MMRQFSLYFFLASSFFSSALFAQNIEGLVMIRESGLELPEVMIYDAQEQLMGQSDLFGRFILEEEGPYTFRKKGYKPLTKTLLFGKVQVIELEEEPLNLEEVVLKTGNFQQELKKMPAAVSLISATEIQSNDQLNYANVLNRSPGVFMHNGTLSTNRITIRGIGSRNLFGTSKIRAYYQDIPLTNGSGETSIEDLDLSGIAKIEILKGPSSSLYGAGLGGTIQLIPDKGTFDQKSLRMAYQYGDYDTRRFQLGLNLGDQKNAAKLLYTNNQSDGYRENNNLDRQNLLLSSNHYLNEKNSLTFVGSWVGLKAQIPSSLDYEDYQNDPRKAAFTWGAAQGFEDYDRWLAGLTWNHFLKDEAKVVTSVFGSGLNSYEARPFNIQDEVNVSLGLRSRYLNNSQWLNKTVQWTVGLELFRDQKRLKTYENLYRDFPPGTGSVQGELLNQFLEKRAYLNVFFDSNWRLSEKTFLDFGLNLNHMAYRLEDEFVQEEDQSGENDFGLIASPRLGLSHLVSESVNLYAQVSHGFSPPKLEETLLPDGVINPDIRPESGWNFEIGSRGRLIKSIFHYELSLYYMRVKDLLVPQRTGDDQFIGVNAGQSTLKGIELAVNYALIDKESLKLYHRNALSINGHRFDDYVGIDGDFSGNQLTGVPGHTFFSELFLDSAIGLYGNLSYNNVGSMPITDDNEVFSEAYQLVNTRIGWKKNLFGDFTLDIYAGINNLFDEKYAPMLQINALAFGTNLPRYYYPGLPFNAYFGLQLHYSF